MARILINQDSLKSRRDFKRHKIQDGSNIFRILPPFGDEEVHHNYPYKKWSVAWLIDPKTGRRRPFATPLTDGGECPIAEYNKALTEYINNLKADLESKKTPTDKIKKRLEGLREIQWKTRVNHMYIYNAADKSGEVGLLEVKSTAHQGLKKMMSQYIKEYGQDPTTLDSDIKENAGVWFNIVKEGELTDTTYTVSMNQIRKKTESGEVIKVDDRTALSDNIVENYQDLGYDLSTLYVRKDYNELKEILLFNLALLQETVPDCVLPGYEVDGIDTSVVNEDSGLETVEEEPGKTASTKTNKVKLSLDSDDSLDDEAPFDNAKSTKTASKNSKSTQDFMAMADSILGD